MQCRSPKQLWRRGVLNIGILGYGTVGQGVVRIFNETPALKDDFRIQKILVQDVAKEREIAAPEGTLTADIKDLFEDRSIDVFVELTGNVDPMAEYILQALRAGKHVVTANKALVSAYFEGLSQAAADSGARFLYEASVAGGVPVLKALQDVTDTNRIHRVEGILNGTCNFILSEMDAGRAYGEALAEAQAIGFAEADPTADVGGFDTMRKLRILSTIAFRGPVREENIPLRGIDTLDAKDLEILRGLGRTVKLLGIADRTERGFSARVVPAALSLNDVRATVLGGNNVVRVETDHVGALSWFGPGAGMLPTANAVWTDLLDIVRSRRTADNPLGNETLVDEGDAGVARYYVRWEEGKGENLSRFAWEPIAGVPHAALTKPIAWGEWKEIAYEDGLVWAEWVE